MQYSSSRLPKVSGGNGFCWSRNWSLPKPSVGLSSMFMSAWLWRVTASSSFSDRGGMSVSASRAASAFLSRYSIAACSTGVSALGHLGPIKIGKNCKS